MNKNKLEKQSSISPMTGRKRHGDWHVHRRHWLPPGPLATDGSSPHAPSQLPLASPACTHERNEKISQLLPHPQSPISTYNQNPGARGTGGESAWDPGTRPPGSSNRPPGRTLRVGFSGYPAGCSAGCPAGCQAGCPAGCPAGYIRPDVHG